MSANTRTWLRLYKTARWQRMRERQLTEQPLCVFCLQVGDVEPATVCDHRIAHKGDEFLFWDAGNLQSLCKTCHDRTKQRLERGQDIVTFGADGWPLD